MPVAAFVAAIAVSIGILAAQPMRSPWWTYADADAAYTGSSLNLLLGVRLRYIEHPGLPLEELGTVAFGAEYLAKRLTGTTKSRHAFVDEQMLHLDRARPVFRGLAIAIYLLGAALSFVLLARMFRHWAWGFAGALLWIAAPGLAAMSIQFRPDVGLAVLILGFAYLIGRALDSRTPWYFLFAGVVLGFATMLKLHAAGAVPALVLAGLWRPPPRESLSMMRVRARAFLARRRLAVAATSALCLAVALALNVIRAPFDLTSTQVTLGLAVAVLGILSVTLALLVRPLAGVGLGVAGFTLGLAIPVAFDIADGLQALVNIRAGLTGGGINKGVPAFVMPLHQLVEDPLKEPFVVFIIAGVAAVIGLVRREPKPVVWFVGAAVLGVMAVARIGAPHYFAPAYILAVLGALWLLRERREIGVLAACILVAYAAWPTWQHRHGPAQEAAKFAALVAPAKAYLAAHERPSEIAFVNSYWPFADSRYFELVEYYVTYTPAYPYKELTGSRYGGLFAGSRGLQPRYFVGPQVEGMTDRHKLTIELGTYTARRVAPLVAELLHGPAVDRPWNQPTAHYDPWTGYFKDPLGHYWALPGQQMVAPARRRYLAHEHVWVDAFGDLWTAKGKHVGNRPELRTAP